MEIRKAKNVFFALNLKLSKYEGGTKYVGNTKKRRGH